MALAPTQLEILWATHAIEDALHRYMRAQDRLDRALHLSAFHSDAFVDCGLMAGTAAEFVDFAQALLADMESSFHMLGQKHIRILGSESAEGEIYFFAQHRIRAPELQDLLIAGRYVDEYACREGEWRILKRRELIDWVRQDPASDGPFRGDNPGLPFGDRSGRDFSETRAWADVMTSGE